MTAIRETGMAMYRMSLRFVWLLLLGACLSPIEFSTQNIGGTVVVAGQVSNVKDQNFVQIGLTAEKERLPYPYSGATVTLVDDGGESFQYQEDPLRPGIYTPPNDFTGMPGKTYHVIAEVAGKSYESAAERMPESGGTINTTYDFETKEYADLEGFLTVQPFINIRANALLESHAGQVYLKWEIEEAFLLSPTDFPDPFGSVPPPCVIVQNAAPQKIVLLNSDDINTNSIEGLVIGTRLVDWSFLERHYFTTYQSSITREAHEYWRKVNVLSSQVGSIFDTPPAKLIGNIKNTTDDSETVYGYFQAANQAYTRFFLLIQDLPVRPNHSPCTFDNRESSRYPSRCLDCLSVPNSSYRRPEWF